jgi:metal-responsive CopG/Arc/MetJ family transcriptional regulator
MKPVQILIDEELLEALDADSEVQKLGRSRVIRELAAQYLRRRRRLEVDASYARGYGDGVQVAEDLSGWDEEGVWPDE